MIYLCCDTNIWINISNGLEPPRLLNRLADEIRDGNIKLILPEIIIKEWQRNKDKTILKKTNDTTNQQIESLEKLNEFLERDEFDMSFLWDDVNADEDAKTDKVVKKINELIDELKAHKSEIVERAKRNIEKVEEIFNHHNTIKLSTDSASSLKVITLAADKLFPFENGKNNFADCLIFFQFINYLKDNNLEKAHFVTSNKHEFFPKSELHEFFQAEIDATKSFFYKSLSEALNKSLNEELVNFKELKRIDELSDREYELDDYCCLVCSENDDLVASVLNFARDIEIVDSRTKIDKNQLLIFEEEEVNDLVSEEIETMAESASCGYCGTEHLVCPSCHEILDFLTYKYNKIQHCENCNLRFIYVREMDRKGELIRSRLELLDRVENCSKCGNEFISVNSGIDICEKCNEEYNVN